MIAHAQRPADRPTCHALSHTRIERPQAISNGTARYQNALQCFLTPGAAHDFVLR